MVKAISSIHLPSLSIPCLPLLGNVERFTALNGYVLSPAFDVVPQIKPHHIYQHALIIGDSAAGTIENLLFAHESFGLTEAEAAEIVENIQAGVQEHWRDVFYKCGFGDEEVHRVERYFQPIPLSDHRAHGA